MGSHGVRDSSAFEAVAKHAREAGEFADHDQRIGLLETKTYRPVDGNGVVVAHVFKDLESAQAHKMQMESAETQERMEAAGAIMPIELSLVEAISFLALWISGIPK
jgi:hypothetical protein